MVVLLFVQCKSTHTTTVKDHFIENETITHKTEVITPASSTSWRYKSPCKNDSLIIADLYMEIAGQKFKLENLNGELRIALEKPADTIFTESTDKSHIETTDGRTEVIITKYRTHKFWWYLLGSVVFYIAYRVARFYFPIIRFLPY